MTSTTPYIGVLLEQTLGHVSHGQALTQAFADVDDAKVSWRELPFDARGPHHRIPPLSNWTVRSSLAARRAVRSLERDRSLDALIVHTHVPATFLGATMARVPTVVSIDATPAQIDRLGSFYNHEVKPGPVESLKSRLHARCFNDAAALVTWSQWAAESLVDDYGIDRRRITVIPPGVTPDQWRRPEPRVDDGGPVKILFVGGDFERKGGDLLVAAVDQLLAEEAIKASGRGIELHLVTSADIDPGSHCHVHRGLTPNNPELIELFHRCDIFALPTRGDCTPVVLAEAANAGLPAVATAVGGVAESVIDGVTGHIVEPTVTSVADGLRPLILDRSLRLEFGGKAVEHAGRMMDSEHNANRLLEVAVEAADRASRPRRNVLTVSGIIPADIDETTKAGIRPLADYRAIADAACAELVDWADLRSDESKLQSVIRRALGNSVAIAYLLYRNRHRFDVIVTDGEQIGLPLAALSRLHRRRSFRHVMISHRLSPRKKAFPIRALGLSSGVDEVLVYSSAQRDVARRLFKLPDHRIKRIDFMVDTKFFQPTRTVDSGPVGRRPLICAAGREFRDYPTLIEAVRDLDVDVVIASASPWSKRADNARSVDFPEHVTVTSMNQRELRQLLDDCDLLVMPLLDSDFQAGVTTILEAMAMERPVVCTATIGQTDVLVEGEHGLFVQPGDSSGLRDAIRQLLDDPASATAMGRRGRELVEERADVRHYADLIAKIVASQFPGRSLDADPNVTLLDEHRRKGATVRPHLGMGSSITSCR